MNEPILQMTNISKSFAGVHALRGVQFELRPGEVHALLGENGAGKSTLVKVITGVHQPDSGEIGFERAAAAPAGPARGDQARHLGHLPGTEPLPRPGHRREYFCRPAAGRPGRLDRLAQDVPGSRPLLDSLGVHLDVKTKARSLSIAQQQMVEIARALSVNARILIMDEPTSALTLSEVADLFRIVRRLREDGTAILFISHRLEELFEIADRVTVLRDGQYVDTRPMAGVTHDELIRMMVGPHGDRACSPRKTVAAGRGGAAGREPDPRQGRFEDVSFELRQGEILGMAGLVGAGRTEVSQAIFGVEPATGGTIEIDGKTVRIDSPQQAMGLGWPMCPKTASTTAWCCRWTSPTTSPCRCCRALRQRGWLDAKGCAPGGLSNRASRWKSRPPRSGRRCASFPAATSRRWCWPSGWRTNPRILILDEPTRGIDVGTKAAVHSLMSELAAQGMAILMISSELPEVLGMSDRILVMREGRVTGLFDRAEATQEKIMTAATQDGRRPSA